MIIELINEIGMLFIALFFFLVFMDLIADVLNFIGETIDKIIGE